MDNKDRHTMRTTMERLRYETWREEVSKWRPFCLHCGIDAPEQTTGRDECPKCGDGYLCPAGIQVHLTYHASEVRV